MNKSFLNLLLLCLTLSALPVYAKSFNEGISAYNQQNYTEAYHIFSEFAEKDIPKAKYYLALMYDQGKGISKNHTEAAKWYQQAAILGDAEAQYNLSIMFRIGYGVQKKYNESVKWARLAAEQGHSEALYYLSSVYELGLGVTANPVMAQVLKILAAKQGHDLATENINSIAHLLSDDQQTEAQSMAAGWHIGKSLPMFKDFHTLRRLN